MHGIGRSTRVAPGQAVRDVALALNRDLAGHTVYCDGWAHDDPWLAALFGAADLRAGFRLESVSALLDEARLARLDAARQDAHSEMGLTRHRAGNDARALQRALTRVSAPAP